MQPDSKGIPVTKKLGEIWRTVTGHRKIVTGMGLHMMGLKLKDLNKCASLTGRAAHVIP